MLGSNRRGMKDFIKVNYPSNFIKNPLQCVMPFSLFINSLKIIILPFINYRNIILLLIIIRLFITTYLMVKHIYYDIDTSSILFQPMFITDSDKIKIGELEEIIKSDISKESEYMKESIQFNEEMLHEAINSKSEGEYFSDSEQEKVDSLKAQRDDKLKEAYITSRNILDRVKEIQKLDTDYVFDKDKLSKK